MSLPEALRHTAYVDCFSGLSGDMFLAALLHAGLPLEHLTTSLALLDLDGYQVAVESTANQSGIQATQVRVLVNGQPGHRHWRAIRQLIERSRLPEAVTRRALAIFQVLAQAEAKVHGCAVEEVHFHEVGAVDSIVDIVGAAIGLDYLGIHTLTCAPLPMPRGWVRSEHGPLPLPAPAVCEILHNLPVYGVDCPMELVTPTGAAIVKAMASDFGPLPAMAISRVGYGAGSHGRPDGRPNLLRLLLGQSLAVAEAQQVTVMETNLDDWSPETFPHVSERLFQHGALDVALIPIQMKKGRPGFTIQVICPPEQTLAVQEILLNETSAIGLRCRREERRTLPRALGRVETALGPIRAKLVFTPGGPRLTPEYEDCRRLAQRTGLAIGEIYRAVLAQPQEAFQPDPSPGAEADGHHHSGHGGH